MLVRKKDANNLIDLKINYDYLLDSWKELYPPSFLKSEYMNNLMSFLYLAYESPNIIMRPNDKGLIFKPFQSCHLEDCNVIMVTEFPTTTPKSSGLGVGNHSQVHAYSATEELDQFRKMIEENLYGGKLRLQFDPTLEEATQNGVLFLNTALTCTSMDNRAHVKHWDKFIEETIFRMDEVSTGKAFVFIGEAAKYAHLVEKKYNEIFIEENSIDYCIKKKEYWTTDVFKRVNDYLIEQHGLPYSEINPFI